MKKIACLMVILFELAFVSAIKISLQPAHISLFGEINKDLCGKINLDSDVEMVFYGEDRWSLKNEGGNFVKYNLKGEELGLKVEYKKEVQSGSGGFDFCVNSAKSGEFYGILYFKSSQGMGAIGSLVYVKASNEVNKNLLIGFSGFSSVLLAFLFLLLMMGNRENSGN